MDDRHPFASAHYDRIPLRQRIHRISGWIFVGSSLLTLLILAALLAGCSRALGYAGQHPGAVECYGKATVTGTGHGAVSVGYGGAETNAYSLSFDCGEKAGFKQYNPVETPASGIPAK